MASVIHNNSTTVDISIYPRARRCTEEQDIFIHNLLRVRTSTSTILDVLHEIFKGTCKLTAKDIQNRRQNYRQKQKAGLPETEMESLMRDLIKDDAFFRIKQNENGNTTHLLIGPKSILTLLQQEQRTWVVQMD